MDKYVTLVVIGELLIEQRESRSASSANHLAHELSDGLMAVQYQAGISSFPPATTCFQLFKIDVPFRQRRWENQMHNEIF